MGCHSTLLLLLFFVGASFGGGGSNDKDRLKTVGWQSDPNNRGTFTLVSSCVLTLTICVYSAMHLNVPPHGESTLQFWLRTIRWALLGIFGPELVVFKAWKQYLSAKTIVKKSKSKIDTKKTSDHSEKDTEHHAMDLVVPARSRYDPPSPWTMVHGFYAGMGGFTFPLVYLTTEGKAPIFKSDCKRLTLTARGVALLAECDLLPNIEKGDLDDKSKADGLSKFIACVQAAWLMVQVIGRLALGLQVTLLEINTLGHVFCALIIYLLWWHKPRNVFQPIELRGDWVGPLSAYMYMSSEVSGQSKETAGILTNPFTQPEMGSLAFFSGKLSDHPDNAANSCSNTSTTQVLDKGVTTVKPEFQSIQIPAGLSYAPPAAKELSRLNSTAQGSFGPRPTLSSPSSRLQQGIRHIKGPDESQELGTRRQLRWSLAAEAVHSYPAIQRRLNRSNDPSTDGDPTTFYAEFQHEEFVQEYCSNWSTKGLLPGDHGLVMGMALWFASMAFGGIHAAAWYDYFPSTTETWLWRCSALYIAWSGLVWMLINLIAQFWKPFDDYWNRTRLLQPPFASSTSLVVICGICGSLYTFARGYLVVEAFISIRKLPVSAYQTPDWTQMIPHL